MSYEPTTVEAALAQSVIGGGDGYDHLAQDSDPIGPDEVDVVVDSEAGLYEEVRKPGKTVYVDDAATIFLTDPLELAANVTLASGRDDDRDGARLICPERGKGSAAENGIIRSRNDGVRISGLRLRGPETTAGFTKWEINDRLAVGIRLFGDARIDNCEIYGFPHAAVRLGSRSRMPTVEIDHCHIHSSYQIGLGYGVDVVNGFAHVHHTWLDDCRHLINGFGFDTCEYTLEDCVLGPRVFSHAVDMHCLEENFPSDSAALTDDREADGNPWYRWRAGGELLIRRNTFTYTESVTGRPQEAIGIRGEPAERVLIEYNRFCHPEPPAANSGNQSEGHCWRQVNVRLDSCNVPTTENGYTANWEVGDNQFNAPDAPWNPTYGAPVNLAVPGAGPSLPGRDLSRQQAWQIARALRDVRAPLSQLHASLPSHDRHDP